MNTDCSLLIFSDTISKTLASATKQVQHQQNRTKLVRFIPTETFILAQSEIKIPIG